MLNVLFDVKRMTLGGGGGRSFEVKFQLSEYMGLPCPGRDCCKRAISGNLNYITRVSISGFVAASCCFSISPIFLSRRFRIPDQNRVNQVGL